MPYPHLLACLISFSASVIFVLIYGSFSCVELSGLLWGNRGMETVLRQHKILELYFLFWSKTGTVWPHFYDALINLIDNISLLQEASDSILRLIKINYPLEKSQKWHSVQCPNRLKYFHSRFLESKGTCFWKTRRGNWWVHSEIFTSRPEVRGKITKLNVLRRLCILFMYIR